MRKIDLKLAVALLALFSGFMEQFNMDTGPLGQAVRSIIFGLIALVCGFTLARKEKADQGRRWLGRILGALGLVLALVWIIDLPSACHRQKGFNSKFKKHNTLPKLPAPPEVAEAVRRAFA